LSEGSWANNAVQVPLIKAGTDGNPIFNLFVREVVVENGAVVKDVSRRPKVLRVESTITSWTGAGVGDGPVTPTLDAHRTQSADEPTPRAPSDRAAATGADSRRRVSMTMETGAANAIDATGNLDTTGGGTGDDPPSPAKLLDELRVALQKADDDAEKERKKLDALEADLKALDKANQDAEKAIQQYAQGKANLDQQIRAAADYEALKAETVEAAVGKKKAAVDKAWDEMIAEETAKENQLKLDRTNLDAAIDKQTSQQRRVQVAQEQFDASKGRLTVLQQRVKFLGELQKGIEAAERESDAVKAYTVLREFRSKRRDAEKRSISVTEFRAELTNHWAALNDAQKVLRAVNLDLIVARQALELTTAQLNTLRADRVAATLKKIPPAVTALELEDVDAPGDAPT
jgi:hypothetical protein